MKKLNIGITVHLKNSVWNNGITQNAIFLAKTLLQSEKDYNVLLLNTTEEVDPSQIPWNTKEIPVKQLKDNLKDLDLLIILGSLPSKEEIETIRKHKCKTVFYKCGNDYIIQMESVLFKVRDSQNNAINFPTFDEIWSIPQMENTNYWYWKIHYDCEVRVIPFVWDPMFLDRERKHFSFQSLYIPQKGPKKISIFEPNINVYKYCMYPLLIVEKVYREQPKLIKHVYVTNTQNIKDNNLFISIMNNLNLVQDKITTFENRYPIPYFLEEHTDIVVAHQWENALNYAYLDAAYLGYPLVHNAHLCKDLGYYYEGFEVGKGSQHLKWALTDHDKNLLEYKNRTKQVLQRYLTTNPESIETYDKLIKNLFN
jgi:hypothetical protein